jgi:fibronectin-binding autotransporter adhesin
MAKLGIAGNTSGVISLQGPAIAGTNTLTFPAETGTALTSSTAVPNTVAWNTTVQTSSFTAVAGTGYFVNTTSATVTVTLPSSAARNDKITIIDYAGTAATNNIVIGPNGLKINASTSPIAIQTSRSGLTLTYIDSTQGWLSTSNVYGGNPPFGPGPIPISYVLVAGGGGAASYLAGGGGAGGLFIGTTNLTSGTTYNLIVGAGGPGGSGTVSTGQNNGNPSQFSFNPATYPTGQLMIGGGTSTGYLAGVSTSGIGGGSGGGGSGGDPAVSRIGGPGIPGQGNSGGSASTIPYYAAGGGGGAGAVGENSNLQIAGEGGDGLASSVTGTPAFYAGGGGGGNYNVYPSVGSPGGSGGGGAGGGDNNSWTGISGLPNTGGGGGGGGYAGGALPGGNGGSGVIIISIPTVYYTGTVTGSPTVTTSGSNTIIRYTATGTYVA